MAGGTCLIAGDDRVPRGTFFPAPWWHHSQLHPGWRGTDADTQQSSHPKLAAVAVSRRVYRPLKHGAATVISVLHRPPLFNTAGKARRIAGNARSGSHVQSKMLLFSSSWRRAKGFDGPFITSYWVPPYRFIFFPQNSLPLPQQSEGAISHRRCRRPRCPASSGLLQQKVCPPLSAGPLWFRHFFFWLAFVRSRY